MASPTETARKADEIARQALAEVKEIRAKVEQLEKLLDQYDLLTVHNRLAVVEERVSELTRNVEQLKPTKAESEDMGAIKSRVAQLEDNKKLGDTRVFQFVMLFVGGVITLTVQIAILFLKK